jgi:hypothetical protein
MDEHMSPQQPIQVAEAQFEHQDLAGKERCLSNCREKAMRLELPVTTLHKEESSRGRGQHWRKSTAVGWEHNLRHLAGSWGPLGFALKEQVDSQPGFAFPPMGLRESCLTHA